MKIRNISLTGFRGVSAPIDINLPSGFAVICGRNGTGKTTICDSIEYALTGKISRYEDKTESGETIEEYLWWRGVAPTSNKSVVVNFDDEDNERATVSMSSENARESTELAANRKKLIDEATAPDDGIMHLTRTLILRDETIAKLSLDLSEPQRFDFVRNAIGTLRFSKYERLIADGDRYLTAAFADWTQKHEKVNSEIAQNVERRSQLAASSTSSQSAEVITRELAKLLNIEGDVPPDIVERATVYVSNGKQWSLRIESVGSEIAQWALLKKQTDIGKIASDIKMLESQQHQHLLRLEDLSKQIAKLDIQIADGERQRPMATRLIELARIGGEIGRANGRCRLCNSEVEENAYNASIQETIRTSGEFEKKLSLAASEKAKLVDEVAALTSQLQIVRQELLRNRARVSLIDDTKKKLEAQLSALNPDSSGELEDRFQLAWAKKEALLTNINRVEKQLVAFRANSVAGELRDMDIKLDELRKRREEVGQAIERLARLRDKVQSLSRTLRRIEGDITDERLAALNPLFKELYARLKPHPEWSSADFHIRGEIRKFLSLRVAEDINPAFVFSSGQRRAAGLAFLLSIHLSRSWSKLRTIVLDDPIQHIDDFRSLHLVELLAAIRRAGWQVICTVEDESLAELLCRRLAGDSIGDGVYIKMGFTPGKGVGVVQTRLVTPLKQKVLLAS